MRRLSHRERQRIGDERPLDGVDLTRARRMYRTTMDMARAFGVARSTINDQLKKQGLPPYPRYQSPENDSRAGINQYNSYANPDRWFEVPTKEEADEIFRFLFKK